MKKHKITLELGTAELNALLYAIELLTLDHQSERPIRSREAMEALQADLTEEHDNAWLTRCLAEPYKALVAHWHRKDTPIKHEIITPVCVERPRLSCAYHSPAWFDAIRRHQEAKQAPYRRALAMVKAIGHRNAKAHG